MDITWPLTVLSISGTILNIKQDRRGFILWSVANLGWFIVDINIHQYAQAALFACYLVLSLWGLVSWAPKAA